MNEREIARLKKRFIHIAAASFAVVMLFMGGLMNLINNAAVENQVETALDRIIDHNGDMPEPEYNAVSDSKNPLTNAFNAVFNGSLLTGSPEFTYTTRYYAVIFPADEDEEPVVKTAHIASVEEKEAVKAAREVRKRAFSFGSFDDYYYKMKTNEDGSAIVVVMDCSSQLQTSRRLLATALVLMGAGMIIGWMVLRAFAGKAAQPAIRNAELQKQFLTNASHELKTPLAVIRANTELQEAMHGSDEWSQSTLRQVDRLQGLIQNLVTITRGQEADAREEKKDIDASACVKEIADNFSPVALDDEKVLEKKIPEGIHMNGRNGEIRQLTQLLVDNAVKYCDPKGTIRVSLREERKNVVLSVSNDYQEGKDKDYSRFFDRFYREDQSHNIDKGGYGIGLSIAENIVNEYHGTIDVSWKAGVIAFTAVLPKK
jgi:two-component system sensor histidine kinase CiaH